MSFSFYSLLEAKKFSQLPQILQDIITDDMERRDMFQEKFLDYDEKDRWSAIRSAMSTCLEKGLFQERAFYHVLFLQEVRGEVVDDKWEEMIEENCEEVEIQYTNCGTQTEEPSTTEEAKQEVSVPMLMPDEPPKRKHSRRYCSTNSTYGCFSCRLNLSSDGSLHNHYKSKLHIKGLRKRIGLIRENVKLGDKVIVDIRSKADDPELSCEIDEDDDVSWTFAEVEKYFEKRHAENPITHIALHRSHSLTRANGDVHIRWSLVIMK